MRRTLTALTLAAGILAAPAVAALAVLPAAVAQPIYDEPYEGCGPGFRDVPGTLQCIEIPAPEPRPSWLSGLVMAGLGVAALIGLLIVG
jgi:hypothetical protein